MLGKDSCTAIDRNQAGFPKGLLRLRKCPPRLWVIGRLPSPDTHCLAMVGTRTPSSWGRTACIEAVATLRDKPVCIVSGLADGIDTYCHLASLQCGLPTVAVLGQGLGVALPGPKQRLAERIVAEGGALVSAFDLALDARKGTFPARNRIISGLCESVLVLESRREGGAMITANYAVEQGRKLLALPGHFLHETAQGTNHLLETGIALPVWRISALPAMLGLASSTEDTGEENAQEVQSDDAASQLWHAHRGRVLHLESLLTQTQLEVQTLLAILGELEIRGLARMQQGGTVHFLRS